MNSREKGMTDGLNLNGFYGSQNKTKKNRYQ